MKTCRKYPYWNYYRHAVRILNPNRPNAIVSRLKPPVITSFSLQIISTAARQTAYGYRTDMFGLGKVR